MEYLKDRDFIVVKRSDLEAIVEEIKALRELVVKEFRSEPPEGRKRPAQASQAV